MHVAVDVVAEAAGDREVSRGGDELRVALGRGSRRQEIPGDLLAEELVVGQVAVEGPDHVIAVAPRVRDRVVAVLARGIGIADHVEPLAAPLLSIGGRRQEPLDEPGERVRRGVGEEGRDLVGRGRQAREVVGDAADQRPRVGRGRGVRAELQEGVDGAFGNGGTAERLEGPVLQRRRLGGAGEGGAGPDPGLDVAQRRVRELPSGLRRRHDQVRVGLLQRFQEQAFLRMARHDGGAAVAALEKRGPRIDAKPALLLLRSVAGEALRVEQGPNPLLEALEAFRGGGLLRRQRSGGEKREDQGDADRTQRASRAMVYGIPFILRRMGGGSFDYCAWQATRGARRPSWR